MEWIVAVLLLVMGIGLIASGSTGHANDLFKAITGIDTGATTTVGSPSSTPSVTAPSTTPSTPSASPFGGLGTITPFFGGAGGGSAV